VGIWSWGGNPGSYPRGGKGPGKGKEQSIILFQEVDALHEVAGALVEALLLIQLDGKVIDLVLG
jgi:hypothetical protein